MFSERECGFILSDGKIQFDGYEEKMKRNLNEIAGIIASTILLEEFQIADEESKQAALSKLIDDEKLRAPPKAKKEEITDEGEDEDEDEDEGEGEGEIEAKPKPGGDDEDEGDKGDFEVQAPDVLPAMISYAQIEKQINNLRAGKSLKDEEISGALEDYFDELGHGETDALFAYLAAIGAILTGGTSGDDAPRPSQMGIKISKPEDKEKSQTPAGEPEEVGIDNLPPGEAPIIVGEIADKSLQLRIVLENYSASDSHRCVGGQIVDFGSSACIKDLTSRIDDTADQRDGLKRGTADRSSLNGTLKYLRQKLRAANKISKQDDELKLQSKLNLADSA